MHDGEESRLNCATLNAVDNDHGTIDNAKNSCDRQRKIDAPGGIEHIDQVLLGTFPIPLRSHSSREVEATVKARGTESEAGRVSQRKRERIGLQWENEEARERDTDQKRGRSRCLPRPLR